MSLDALLKEKLTPPGTPERGGLILKDGSLVEFTNLSPDPLEGFVPDPAEVIPHIGDAEASWHTHPGASANLSSEDATTFVAWADWRHAIVGEDGVRWYLVKHGAVVNG